MTASMSFSVFTLKIRTVGRRRLHALTKPGFEREWAHAGEHVPAIRRGVDQGRAFIHLREQVVDVGPGTLDGLTMATLLVNGSRRRCRPPEKGGGDPMISAALSRAAGSAARTPGYIRPARRAAAHQDTRDSHRHGCFSIEVWLGLISG